MIESYVDQCVQVSIHDPIGKISDIKIKDAVYAEVLLTASPAGNI